MSDRREARKEAIAELLEWYEAALNSWTDSFTASGDYGAPTANAVIHHPSYRELERLLAEMRAARPETYWNITQRYLYAPSKVVLRCSHCAPDPDSPAYALLHRTDQNVPSGAYPDDPSREPKLPMHTHKRKVFTLRPCRVRCPSLAIRPELVSAGIHWLEQRWKGPRDAEIVVPDFRSKKERELDRAEARREARRVA